MTRTDIRLAVVLLVVVLAASLPQALDGLPAAVGLPEPGAAGEAGAGLAFVVTTRDGRTVIPAGEEGVYEFSGPLGLTLVEVSGGRARPDPGRGQRRPRPPPRFTL